jgi:tetratricopeptide (TPR) repeat protein
MERKKHSVILSILFWGAIQFLSANNGKAIYNAYLSGNMSAWRFTIDNMTSKQSKAIPELIELVNYQYGYIGWAIGNNQRKLAETYLKAARKNLELIQDAEPSLYYSYKAAFIGFEIGLHKYKAPLIGFQTIELVKQAIEIDKTNPFALIEKGNILFYMPSIFGGSKKNALDYYLSAYQIMSNNTKYKTVNWNYLNVQVLIAKTYEELGFIHTAIAWYEKILSREPKFIWVKDDLYPKLLKKIT